jgi:NAD(P)-dependent dehydrogenase (short-subunit alcohol dehydrogenase family)
VVVVVVVVAAVAVAVTVCVCAEIWILERRMSTEALLTAAGKAVVGFSGLVALWFSFVVATRPEPVFPVKQVEDLLKKSSLNKGRDTIVIITGSTGGLGLALAEELFRYGITVIIASRTESKCQQVVEDIKKKYPDATGALDYGVIDTGDLQSVVSFVNWFKSKYTHLNILVNNAGQHYAQGETPRLSIGQKRTHVTKQGYDEVFSINYLGHFLLTHLLLPMIKKGRVVHVASAYHFGADGSTLRPRVKGELIDAANGQERGFDHRHRAYAVTKLAQVLHARELQRRLDAEGNSNVTSVVLCPGWVRTGMIPKGAIGAFLNRFNFTIRCGTLVMLCTMFDDKLKGGEWLTNYILPPMNTNIGLYLLRIITKLGLRMAFTDLFALILVLVETRSYGYHTQRTSEEAEDKKLAKDLYNWTLEELKEREFVRE